MRVSYPIAPVTEVSPYAFDVFESKLRRPLLDSRSVSRPGIVNRLRIEQTLRLALVVAPAGYGKTAMLAQWATREARPVAWLTIDGRDDDPLVLLRHLAVALERIGVVGPLTIAALAGSPALWSAAAPRLTADVAATEAPFALVLDGADSLAGESAEVISALGDEMPEGCLLVLAGRTAPHLSVARLRSAGHVLELGVDELAFGRREVRQLLQNLGVHPSEDELETLLATSEGWPAGVCLAAVAHETGLPLVCFSGSDRDVRDYLWTEELSRLPATSIRFLQRISVLEELSGPLCDVLLEVTGSAVTLRQLAASNLLIPLDRHGEWYRCRRLVRQALRSTLVEEEPGLAPLLDHRAAIWLEAHARPEAALDHALAARDAPRAARLLRAVALPVHEGGRSARVETWINCFAEGQDLREFPSVAALRGWLQALRGDADAAERSLEIAIIGGSERRGPGALLRSALCQEGVERMASDAEIARGQLGANSPWRPVTLLLAGVASVLCDQPSEADDSFAAAARAAERSGATATLVLALSERSLLASTRADYSLATHCATEARGLLRGSGVASYPASALAYAVSARTRLRQGRWADARAELVLAEQLAGPLTHALPWLTVQIRLALAMAYVTLRDRAAALGQLTRVYEVVALRPELGTLAAGIAGLQEQLADFPDPAGGHGAALTAAELRLLPLLATHLSFREIGDHLYVSRNTIKTQAISAYRKLGVVNRSAAIARAIELGLVEQALNPAPLRRTGLR